ncbi:MAG: DUF5719 family protein [Actinomycetota bacterium]
MILSRSRELVMGATLIAVLALGVAFDGVTDETEPPAPVAEQSRIFTERAVFCPSSGGGTEGTVHLAGSGFDESSVTAGIEPGDGETQDLGARALFHDVDDNTPLGLVGYGGRVAASAATTYTEPVGGLASAACSTEASTEWFFPQGSVALGFNESLILYNPFPDEAVVRVTFHTKGGSRSKANLNDVAIPSGDATTLRMNRFILQQKVLGAEVRSVRGRFVAWKVVFAKPENQPPGASLTLGATEPALEWYFPTGASGDGLEERLSILNPSDEEALVDVSLITDKRMIQPESLVGFKVDVGSTREIDLSHALDERDVGSVSVVVRSVNGVELVAERSVWYDSGAFRGYASEIGATEPSTNVWLGLPAANPTSDSIIILNLGEEEAEVDVELRRASGEPLRPDELQGITVATGGRGRIDLDRWSQDEPVVAIISSSSPVVAERIAYSGSAEDVAALMGLATPDS